MIGRATLSSHLATNQVVRSCQPETLAWTMFCTDFICRADKQWSNGMVSPDITRHDNNGCPARISRRVTDPNPPSALRNAGNKAISASTLPALATVVCRWVVIIVGLTSR